MIVPYCSNVFDVWKLNLMKQPIKITMLYKNPKFLRQWKENVFINFGYQCNLQPNAPSLPEINYNIIRYKHQKTWKLFVTIVINIKPDKWRQKFNVRTFPPII